MRKYRWWHGVLFFGAVQALGIIARSAVGGLPHRSGEAGADPQSDRDYYRTERLPIFAPPAAAFPVAWTINCVGAIAGGIRVLNAPADAPGRREFVRLQLGAWTVFVLFNAGYFGLRSPLNAALLTAAYSAFTGASVAVAVRKLRDPRVVAALAPTVVWLTIANPLGILQAAWNRDEFWRVGPLCEPPPRLLKGA